MDLISMMKLENLICQATQGLYSDVDSKKETVDMPQLQSIDVVVEVLEPLEESVSIPEEAFMSDARWEMVKAQHIYVNVYHRTERNLTIKSVMTMLQQTKQTNSGPTLR